MRLPPARLLEHGLEHLAHHVHAVGQLCLSETWTIAPPGPLCARLPRCACAIASRRAPVGVKPASDAIDVIAVEGLEVVHVHVLVVPAVDVRSLGLGLLAARLPGSRRFRRQHAREQVGEHTRV